MSSGPAWSTKLREEIGRAVIGQDVVVERMLVALLANGHVLLEGMPGLAKTLLVKSLGTALGVQFERIQFTPDLLPSDVVGTMIFSPKDGSFSTHRGPIFANLVLADEINRAPAKVQSALLEAMQERQVTIGGASLRIPAESITNSGRSRSAIPHVDHVGAKRRWVWPTWLTSGDRSRRTWSS
jgi:MoxR-like ATPase